MKRNRVLSEELWILIQEGAGIISCQCGVHLLCMDRLVKGDGEIIEEIVSKDRHRAINKVSLLSSNLEVIITHSLPRKEMGRLFRLG